MLPKSRRLTTEDFKHLRQGRVTHTPHFLLRLFPVSPTGLSQAGKAAVVVSASTYKKAVDRNLLRRRMYHVIEAHHSLLQGHTLTLTLKKGALDASFRELEQEFITAVQK